MKAVLLPRSKVVTSSGFVNLKTLVYVSAGQGFISLKSFSGRVMTQIHLSGLEGNLAASLFNESPTDTVTFGDIEVLDFDPVDTV
jgi:hypothetical protein